MEIIRSLLKMLMMIIFVGWIFVWVMLSTKVYKETWVPKFTKHLNTKYFGPQGTNFVLLTIPMMFIAAMSCIYLQIQKKPTQPQRECKIKGRMGRVVMVMNPLGVVTATELTFSLLFVALLIWALSNYLYVSCTDHLHNHGDHASVRQTNFRSFGLSIGYVGHICWAFLFFPVTRASTILPLFGLTSESSIKYHIWLGHISNFCFLVHTICFLIYWAMVNKLMKMFAWDPIYVPTLAGTIAMVIAIAMWVTSLPYIRRKKFEIFFYTHQLYALYIVFYVLHVGDSWFCMILPNIFLFFIDRYLRFLQSTKRTRLISARILPSDNLELTFSKTPGVHYTPTSLLFLHVPSISKIQWHPFSITSSSNLEKNTLSVVIKTQGSWTQKLYTHISSSIESLQVSTEGPYGPTSFDFLRHDSLILVSGGSGITPFISIIRELIFQSQNPTTRLPNVLLVCAFKHYHDLALLDLIFPSDISVSDISRLNLRIEAYVTREGKRPDTNDDQRLLQTKWFKPQPRDSPISPILGPNNFLWLGVVVLSSFLMFLLLVAIVTRFHIYPIDRNTELFYNFSYRSLWDMFLGCVCIFISSSAVFLWRKSMNLEGDRASRQQVQSVDFKTPTSSPGSWFCSHQRELESVPYQSIVQATSVHFGCRPNLKKILFETESWGDVGVMVCGPRKIRHEVARICSSGLAKNLHFEAISFSW